MPLLITPEKLAGTTEHSQQMALFCWRNIELREGRMSELQWMHAIPNGGERNPAVAAKMRAEGVMRGIFDIFLPVPRNGCHGLYIEMKSGKNQLTEEQFLFSMHLRDNAYACVVCYDWKAAVAAILKYLGYTA